MRYNLRIKEYNNEYILTPSYNGRKMSLNELCEFFGLDEPNVEWWEIYEADEYDNEELIGFGS